ncbi:hypothetical protein G3570_09420 [Balneolaceae bacterium YR4-1]|uniref:DUF1593 domain-containing protein n=1 Tax=Halalkalibaculum roseum TaxID=2709311 RepID=A0A6M1SNC1_9BACT|nr:hypothetical protein [Halalkalibaculum roseum]NGP76851.1 hypothetical protein [Halalkalibaculum roseum]
MKPKIVTIIAILTFIVTFNSNAMVGKGIVAESFDIQKDLLLLQCDFKTDVDDLQTVAAFATLLHDSRFSKINYHAVAGTYGIQEGLYVPPNPLFQLAFGDNWTDAHKDSDTAVEKLLKIIKPILSKQGDIWISEAGQSDFTAKLIKAIQSHYPDVSISQRIHVVQHAEWNEEATSPESLEFVKKSTDYHKIPDGNGVGNGTPGFRNPEFTQWKSKISNPKLTDLWQLAIDISNEYNGKEGRYNNEAISAGGLDFSDLAAVCWILGIHNDIKDVEDFFDRFSN